MRNRIAEYGKKLFSTGFFHIFGSNVINKILSFASGILLVRILTKSEYGIYSYANTLMGFFLLVSGFGMASGLLQVGSEQKLEEKRMGLYRYACRFGFLFNLLLAAVIQLVALVIPLPIAGSGKILALMCLYPLATLMRDLKTVFLRTQMRNQEFSYANTVSSASIVLLTCTFSLLFRTEGLVLGQYLACMLTIWFIRKRSGVRISLEKSGLAAEEKRDLLGVCAVCVVSNGLSELMYLLDVFILGLAVPDETVIASYKVATTIPTALTFIPLSVITYAYPYFARNRDNRAWMTTNYRHLVLAMGGVNFVIAGGLILIAPWLIGLVFGRVYLDAVLPFQILCASYIFSGTFRIVSGNLLVTQRKLKFNLFMAVFSSAMNTVLNVFMIRVWSSVGAALATFVTALITSILSTAYLIKTIRTIPQ